MSKARQLSMFGDERIDAAALVSIDRPRASLSKAQQAFNRMVAKIGSQRDLLRQWREFLDTTYTQRVGTELEPLQRQLRDAQHAMAHLIDALLSRPPAGERLGRSEKTRLVQLLLAIVDAALAEGPDPALEALHDKYSDTTRAALRQADLKMTEAFLGNMLGPDAVKAHGATSAEELFAHAQRKMADQVQRHTLEREAKRGARARKQGGASKAQQIDERNAKATREAGQSVREIYRKLASALHPDRETDPQERARKTSLMQRVNQSYERDDLLGLLSLQIEIEQIDPEHIADVPDERLARYNHVLREQLARLEAELTQTVVPMRSLCGRAPWDSRVTPKMVESVLERQIAEMRGAVAEMQRDLVDFRDPKLRRERLRAFASAMREDTAVEAEDEFAALLAALADSAPAPSRARRRR